MLLRLLFIFIQLLGVLHLTNQNEPFEIGNSETETQSPLDDESLPSSGNVVSVAAEDKRSKSDLPYGGDDILTVKGVSLPDCSKGCTAQLFRTLSVAVKSGNDFERFRNVCPRFEETVECLSKLKHCSSYELFNILTSGLRYMCVDQKEAFNATIECIDQHADQVKHDCAKECRAEAIMAGWAIYAGLRGTPLITPRIGSTPSKVDVLFFRKITTEGCTILECYLGCLKKKYNTRCYGTAGSLLSEVLVRPVAVGHDSILLGPLANLLKLLLPVQCNFLMTKSGLSHYRMDQRLEKNLKNSVGSRSGIFDQSVSKDSHQNKLNPEVDPWRKDILTSENSPIDNDRFNTEQKGTYQSPLEENTYNRELIWRTVPDSAIDKRRVNEARNMADTIGDFVLSEHSDLRARRTQRSEASVNGFWNISSLLVSKSAIQEFINETLS